MRLTKQFPWLYPIRVRQKQLFRVFSNKLNGHRFSIEKGILEKFSYACKKHQSLLHRKLGDSDPTLQKNKIINLARATKDIDKIIIHPGETFSFWTLVGKPIAKRGYIEGMLLSQGKVTTGIGGGLCQLANLLYWMALHTPLKVVERHHHSFDAFPDEGRVLPFGSGAGVFYNYVDLKFYNSSNQAFIIHVFLTDRHLKGAIYTDKPWPYTYHIIEEDHAFIQKGQQIFRTNNLYRDIIDKRTGNTITRGFIMNNYAEVKYDVQKEQLM